MTQEIEADRVLSWLQRAGPEAADWLPGARWFSDDQPDAVLTVDGVDLPGRALLLSAGGAAPRRTPFAAARRGWFLDEDGALARRLAEAATPGERREKEQADALQRQGVPVARLTRPTDIPLLAAALADRAAGRLPPASTREEVYDLVKRARLHGLGADLVGGWREAAAHEPPDVRAGLRVLHAHLLRLEGRLDASLALTVPAAVERPIPERLRAVLATERGFGLADRFERWRDPAVLREAEQCAAFAWAVTQDERASALYQRLDGLRGRSGA